MESTIRKFNNIIKNIDNERKVTCCMCGKHKVKYKYSGSTIFECNFCSKVCLAEHCIKLHKIKEV